MKVCFIAGTLGRGGAERQLLYMLQALQGKQISARVLCLTRGEAYEKEIERLGVEVEWIGSSELRIRRLLTIINNVRKKRADILQSAHFYTNIYAAAAGKVLKIPSIGAIRSDLTFELAANGIYGKWQLKLPKHLISNSGLAIERTLSRGVSPWKIDLLKNVVNVCPLGEKKPDKIGKPLSILFAGRLSGEKRPEVFVDLAARLVRKFPKSRLRFELAGDGPLRNQLEIYALQCGLSKQDIIFLGDQADMSKVYKRTDILVLTSQHEGTPNVVLEAMAYGIPVVATRVGSVSEILGEQRGLVVEASDLDGLCSATRQLIQEKDLRSRMGKNGRDYVVDNHSLPYLTERLTDIYSKVLGDGQLNG